MGLKDRLRRRRDRLREQAQGLRNLAQAIHHEAMHPGLPPPHVEAKNPLWREPETLVSEAELAASRLRAGGKQQTE